MAGDELQANQSTDAAKVTPNTHRAVLLYFFLALLIPFIGVAYVTIETPKLEVNAYQNLQSIARLKADRITDWLLERQGDALVLKNSENLILRVEQFQKHPEQVAQKKILQSRLDDIRAAYGYSSVLLLDNPGHILLRTGTDTAASSVDGNLYFRALASRKIVRSDLYLDQSGHVQIDWMVPLVAADIPGKPPLGAIVMRMAPQHNLYQLIQALQLTSATAEILLVRRDGGRIVYLNELQYHKSAAFRELLADTDFPASVAVKSTTPGITSGKDNRGVEVLAAYTPVPQNNWDIIAKIDRKEVLAPMWATVSWIELISAILLAVVMLLLYQMIRQQRKLGELRLQEERFRSDRMLQHFYDLPFIGMAITAPENKRWLRFNDRLCQIFSYSREELAKMTWMELVHPDDLDASIAAFERVLRGESEGYAMERRFIRKDGATIFALIDIKCIREPGGKVDYFITTVENITERRLVEEKIKRQKNLFAALSYCNEAIVRSANPEELFRKVCHATVQFGGMKMAWIGLVDEANQTIKIISHYGDGTEYLDGIEISTNPDDPLGQGPSGMAIRNVEPYWCQDFQNDPHTLPWHERARHCGLYSSASLPILCCGKAVGTMTLYSGETASFDEDARELLTEMAMDISFALDAFDREDKRIESEAHLRESEEQFRSLVEQSLTGIYIIQNRKLVYANPRFKEIMGYSHDDSLLGIDPLDTVSEKDRNAVSLHLEALHEGRMRSASMVFTALRKDGTTVEVGVSRTFASYQQSPAIIGLMQDISDRKVAEEHLKRYAMQLEHVFIQTVGVATSMGEMRDPYTAGHQRRVSGIAVAIGAVMGLSEHDLEGLEVGGFLHDIGKIAIPAEILVKPGRLTPIEYELIKTHPKAGYDVLKNVDFPWPVAQITWQHHERIDGTGYPQGLKGDEIILGARIMAVADVVEAMASHRPYRPGLGVDKALEEIEQGRGSAYDPPVVDACLKLFRENGYQLPG